jgi:RNA polymerase sigma factor (sigma-70 family)
VSAFEQESLSLYAREGDSDAFRRIVERHEGMVYAACYRILGNAGDAEDASQDCFLQLTRHAPKLRAPIAGWLHLRAVRSSIDLLRSNKARRARERRAVRRERTSPPTWEDLKIAVDQEIGELPEELRTPIVLYYLEGRKQEEIAAELGIGQTAVSKRLSRGVEQLRQRLHKAGWTTTAVLLSGLLLKNSAEAAPATLTAALGKMALAGSAVREAAAGSAAIGAAKAAVGGGFMMSKAGLIVAVAMVLVLVAAAVSVVASQQMPATGEASPGAMQEEQTAVGEYDVTIPDDWKQMISVGKLSLVGSPFYGVPWDWGVHPVVRVNLPVKNLTAETLYLSLNYASRNKGERRGGTGMGICYTFAPGEERVLDALAPVASLDWPVRFLIRMGPPRLGEPPTEYTAHTVVVTVDPLPVAGAVALADRVTTNAGSDNDLDISAVRLARTGENANILAFDARNNTDKPLCIGAYVGVCAIEGFKDAEPMGRDRGAFTQEMFSVPAHGSKTFEMPYDIPSTTKEPTLAFTVFEPREEHVEYGERDIRRQDVALLAWGSLGLKEAAERGECLIPEMVPVKERADLTEKTESAHFVYYYRPESYAQEHLEEVISQRERAYKHLSESLDMQLPERVRLDLYPDMEAKGLGSGTTWTPANTVNNQRIAEVYSQSSTTDPYHELAHIFSYHFPNYVTNKAGGLVEGFAVYFDERNISPESSNAISRDELLAGKLPTMSEMFFIDGVQLEAVSVIDFLLRKDLAKFKTFYVDVTGTPTDEALQNAALKTYGLSIEQLEGEWHEYLKASEPSAN